VKEFRKYMTIRKFIWDYATEKLLSIICDKDDDQDPRFQNYLQNFQKRAKILFELESENFKLEYEDKDNLLSSKNEISRKFFQKKKKLYKSLNRKKYYCEGWVN
jgi:hypothetical protein